MIAGLVMAAATLAVIAGAEHSHSEALARTMGMTTFALANLFFSFTARDHLRSVFNLEDWNDRTFLTTSLMSVGGDRLRHRAAASSSGSWTPIRCRATSG